MHAGGATRRDESSHYQWSTVDSMRDAGGSGEEEFQDKAEDGGNRPRQHKPTLGSGSFIAPSPPQDPKAEEDKDVLCVFDRTKSVRQSALRTLKEIFFSEIVHKTEKPQSGGDGSTWSRRPFTLEELEGSEGSEAHAQEEGD